ncbi:MAG: ExbD/TolR family protein [Cyclobacteriaceae bacterium]
MSKFRKKTKTSQAVPTSSLPDIIFILLFFFMVATKPIEQTLVKVAQPQASELQELEKVNLVSNIYIGSPNDKSLGSEPRVQADDIFVTPDQIPQFIETQRVKLGDAKAGLLEISLKIDKNTKMGMVIDVEEQLREVDARKVSYSANKKGE